MKYMKGKIILHSILKTTITGFVFLHLWNKINYLGEAYIDNIYENIKIKF
jgi:hypothetical protein